MAHAGGTMNHVIRPDFLLESAYAEQIYSSVASLPVIDYHCHLEAKEIAENKIFRSITEAWLGGDHYKWRAMRMMGIQESLITGNATDWDKFSAYAGIIPYMPGHPLYHFSHLELDRYFGITDPLSPVTAAAIYKKANEILARLPARRIIEISNVETIVTTNDPLDDLRYHKQIASDKCFSAKVLPAFRPDKAINIENAGFAAYLGRLAATTNREINTLSDVRNALGARFRFFVDHGTRAADHGLATIPFVKDYEALAEQAIRKALAGEPVSRLEADAYKTALLVYLGGLYASNDVVMELHFGCSRNTNSLMFDRLGPDSGYDIIRSETGADNIAPLLDELERRGALPKTILYSLNPADDPLIGTVIGSFQKQGVKGRVQQGSAWWFNDNLPGIRRQLRTYATQAPLDTFIGMLTDSRSFLSYPRHDYFRRILSDFLGGMVQRGEYPQENLSFLIETARNIAYNNVKEYIFGVRV